MSRQSLLDASIRIDNVPPDGRDLEVETTSEQRAAIAERLGISAINSLTAELRLSRFRGGLRIEGGLDAVTVQPCVVTFVPVQQQIHEAIERIFLPASEQPKSATTHPEAFVDLEADEMPDYFEGHEVDLGDAIVETIALALDPYPRAEGVSVDDLDLPGEGAADEAEDSPFAGLRRLLPDKDKE